MKLLRLLTAVVAPMMVAPGQGARREPVLLTLTNNGDRALSVVGVANDDPVAPGASAAVELEDASHLVMSFDGPVPGDHDGKARIEIANKCGATLSLHADGASYPIETGKSISLTVNDLDTLSLTDAGVTAGETLGSPPPEEAPASDDPPTPEEEEAAAVAQGSEGEGSEVSSAA